jgi:Domain of unknown function (DUF4116)
MKKQKTLLTCSASVSAALALAQKHKLDVAFITHTTHEFQVQNMDLIVEAIKNENIEDRWCGSWLEDINQAVWSNKHVVMASIQKGCSITRLSKCVARTIVEHIVSIDGDKDIVLHFVKNHPAHLKYASSILQQDRDFILELVTAIDAVLHHAPVTMKYDRVVLLAAVARSSGTISDCFDCFDIMGQDFEFLCDFASEIRSTIVLRPGMTDPSCRLSSWLSQWTETVAAFQTLIAEFADMPLLLGSTELDSRQAALINMEKLGF